MIYAPRVIAGIMLFALAVAAPGAAGCIRGGTCNCPNSGGFANVTVPAAQSSPIAAASATGACTASFTAGNDVVEVLTGSAGACQVFVELANGDTYTFAVEFTQETIHGACDCSVIHTTGGTPVPTLSDAGING